MKTVHRYTPMQNKIQRAFQVAKHDGIRVLLIRMIDFALYRIRMLFSPFILLFKPKNNFSFLGQKLDYFYHAHNTTWTNERAIEIPLVKFLIKDLRPDRVLEVGAVMYHYNILDYDTDVVDKFEVGKGIINQDITEFHPRERYDLIVSLSTFEHIGFDDDKKDSNKIYRAMQNLKENCIKNNGVIVITMPLGYNPWADSAIEANTLGFNSIYYFKRINKQNHWQEVSKAQVAGTKYGDPFKTASAIVIGVVDNRCIN